MDEMRMERSLVKGLLAGVIAGLVATAAKVIAEKMYAPQSGRGSMQPGRIEETFSSYGREEAGTGGKSLSEADWAFGIAAGAAYGVLAEFYPTATAGEGKTFGLALMTLTHETALPVGDMSSEFEDQPDREQASEAASHLVFGTVAEQVRNYVRSQL